MNNFLIGLTQIETEWALNEKLNQLFDVSLVMKMCCVLKKYIIICTRIASCTAVQAVGISL